MWMTRSADDMRLERQRAGGWSEDGIRQTLDTMRTTFSNSGPAPRYYVTIDGMFHVNFTDAPFWSPLLSRIGLTGPIDGRRGTDILNSYTSAFFDSALLDQQSPLLQGETTPYAEVHLDR